MVLYFVVLYVYVESSESVAFVSARVFVLPRVARA